VDSEWINFLLTHMQDYYATIYAAEIINTLTNLLFMYLATKGIHNCIKNGHDTVFLVAFIGYLLVGSGSFLFHATLKCTRSPRAGVQSLRRFSRGPTLPITIEHRSPVRTEGDQFVLQAFSVSSHSP
jgi:hypothetical protein